MKHPQENKDILFLCVTIKGSNVTERYCTKKDSVKEQVC